MRGKRSDGKPRKPGLPSQRKNVQTEPIPGSIGALLRKERIAKQIPQSAIAAKLGFKNNGTISQIELGKKIPTDKVLSVFANMLRLSAPTLREKRDASTRRPWAQKKPKGIPVINARKPPSRLAAKTSHAIYQPDPEPADPAGAPAVADWIEMVDGIVRMPFDPADRKRWFAATMELLALRGKQ